MAARLVNFFWRRRRHRFGVAVGPPPEPGDNARVTPEADTRVTPEGDTRAHTG